MLNESLKKLSELDIFCLIVFKTLYENGHANTTASELQVSAPKVSRCLTQLRITFNDELFYRRLQGLKPTPLAEALYEPICGFYRVVNYIEQVAFDEDKITQIPSLNIAVTQSIMSSLAVAISEYAEQEAMGKVRLHCWDSHTAERIHNGELDFGIGFDTSMTSELECELLGSVDNVHIAARVQHPIWQYMPNITLEQIAQQPFLYLESKGFNDKVDPLEMYCRNARVELKSVDKVASREAWFCHLMTMGSIAFLPAVEAGVCNSIPSLRTESLPKEQVSLLHGDMLSPQYFIVEQEAKNRRYTIGQREILIQIVADLLHTY
ncbi:Regulatory protein, LysR [Shewanella piezotolerans WP3]|uniref:Regulatory protein, LysR n=1 Tax=Shewanella piezotolerans (strain WP3 / JCM 13877) TaxID=225849 RepID=B8CJZ9_SHEPW|nr:LysR family transcriptional regulator [Shewanella piezotolerans]ACJ27702.1 Regulatory protein, LysR [Shewanella piezotolerans WP3]